MYIIFYLCLDIITLIVAVVIAVVGFKVEVAAVQWRQQSRGSGGGGGDRGNDDGGSNVGGGNGGGGCNGGDSGSNGSDSNGGNMKLVGVLMARLQQSWW